MRSCNAALLFASTVLHRAAPKLAHRLLIFRRCARRLPTCRHLRTAVALKIFAATWTVALVLSTGSGTATAATLVDADAAHNNNLSATDAGGTRYNVRLDPLPAPTPGLGFTASEISSVKAAAGRTVPNFNGWTITNAAAQLPGTLTIDRYDAYTNNAANSFRLVYDSGWQPNAGLFADLAAGNKQLVWIQLVYTNSPCKGGVPKPYLDPQCGTNPGNTPDDDLPFYWTATENVDLNLGGFNAYVDPTSGNARALLVFSDTPGRPLPGGSVNWYGHLAIAEWDKATPGTVKLYDSILWGFKFDCLIGPNPPGTDTRGGAAGDKPGEDTGEVPSPLVCGSVGGIAELPDTYGGQAMREHSPASTATVWLVGLAGAGGILFASVAWYARRRPR